MPATATTQHPSLTDLALARERGMVWDRLSPTARSLLIHIDGRSTSRELVDGVPVPVRILDVALACRVLDCNLSSLDEAVCELHRHRLMFPVLLQGGDYAIVQHAHAGYAARAARALRRDRTPVHQAVPA